MGPEPVLTRIVTVYRQWDFVARWAGNASLVDPRVAWIFVSDAPDAPAPPAIRESAVGRCALFVEPPANEGRCAARNRGAALARSAWIENVDGDDTPLPVDSALFDPDADLLLFPGSWHDDRFEPGNLGGGWSDGRTDTAVFRELLAPWGVGDWRLSSTLWKREFYLRIGGYDARFEGAEDAHLVWKALRLGAKAGRIERPKQSVHAGEARAGQFYLTAGRLRFWEAAAAAGSAAAARAVAVQRKVVFWTLRDEVFAASGPGFLLREAGKALLRSFRRGRR